MFFSVPRDEDLDAVRAGLSLLTGNPHAIRVEIGDCLKTDMFDRTVDLVVYAEFADEAALAAYRAHPIYQDSIDRVRPLRELRIAGDYVVERAVTTPIG